MDADGNGTDAPAPASHGPGVSHRTSSALAAVSVFLILLCLFWRFIWQCLKHEGRSAPTSGAAGATTATTSSSSAPPPPSCPSRDGAAANGAAGNAAPRTTSRLPAFVRVAVAAGLGGEKVDCAVCLAEIGDGEAAARLSPGCGHGFHAECIEAWFRVNSTCPLCRAAVDAPAPGQGAVEAPLYCSSV